MPIRSAEAFWEGSLQDGSGRMSFGSGAFEGQYSFSSRFEEGSGTNPEELIAAAEAGCFSMALSADLGKAGYTATRVATSAEVNLTKMPEGGWSVTRIDLRTEAEVPGLAEEDFQQIANSTKDNCPISRLLSSGTEITLDAKLA